MTRSLTLAAIQFTPSDDIQDNIDRVAGHVREAAEKGADVILPPELFTGFYFCKTQEEEHFARACPWREHPAVEQLSGLAAELGVVIPVSIYEKDGPLYYNSLVMIDADGTALGVSQEPYSRRAGLSGKILFPAGRHRVPGLGHDEGPYRRGHLLGSVVPGSCARDGADGC